ncbi:MAG: metal ABC transporter permease [Candidatus Dormibacteria bacterium]
MTFFTYLSLPAVQHALVAATLVAISSGIIGPFVIMRGMSFAVHGTSELAFTGAAAGLLVANDAVSGALIGALFVALLIGLLGNTERERDSSIGVILAAGLGLGVLLLSFYRGFASAATNILFGDIFGVSMSQIVLLVSIAAATLLIMSWIYRPLLFASVDHVVAQAMGVPLRIVGLVFLFLLALTVTEAAQIVGTLLVLSLAISPAAAAVRWTVHPRNVIIISILLALLAADGGLILSLLVPVLKPSVCITGISFCTYIIARYFTPHRSHRTPSHVHEEAV